MKTKITLMLTVTLATTVSAAAGPQTSRPDAQRLAHACSGCHGTYGHSHSPTPSLAGKPEDDFTRAMMDFQSGQRVSSIMNRIARGYTKEDIEAMAKFFTRQ